jgi:Spy/CpxP family protein refolding chaperone
MAMKSWIKRSLAGLFGAAVVVGSLSACGHRPHDGGWNASAEQMAERRAKMVARVADKLDLDAAQKAKLEVLAGKLSEQRSALMAGAHPREQAQALVAGEKFDRAGAQALVDQKTDALKAKAPEVVTALGDFYDSLTPTQQQKVRDFMQRRGGWRRG